MVRWRWATAIAGLGMTGLTGCFSTVHRVAKVQPQAPGTYRTATAESLEKLVSDRDAAIKTLQASVELTATTGGERTGKETTYSSFRGYIFLERPAALRVILQLPFVGSKAMDMVSDGKTFTLVIPPKNTAYVGTSAVNHVSEKGLENLRPSVFLDSLLVPGVAEGEFVTLTESFRISVPAKGRRPAIEEPEYDLEVLGRQHDKILRRKRVLRFSRITLLPFEQDIYNDNGQVVTRTLYENYQPVAGGNEQPQTILISRPLDQYSLRIDVTKTTMNPTFDPDQFEAPKVPATFKVVRME